MELPREGFLRKDREVINCGLSADDTAIMVKA